MSPRLSRSWARFGNSRCSQFMRDPISPQAVSKTQEEQAMRPTDELDGNVTAPCAMGSVIDSTVEDVAEEERPDDALTCPLLDTPIHFDDCKLCRRRGWVHSSDISAYLGPSRVPCLSCGGEGGEESGGPVTWTCTSCLGTWFMPTSLLAQFDLTKYPFYDRDWRNVNVSGQDLRGATFDHCDFTDAIFDGTDLTNTTFKECQFAGANPEAASSLEGTVFQVTGLSAEQRVACAARGAAVEDLDDEEDD